MFAQIAIHYGNLKDCHEVNISFIVGKFNEGIFTKEQLKEALKKEQTAYDKILAVIYDYNHITF